MDGFAVMAGDTFGASRYEPKPLRVIDKVYTGEVGTKPLEPGTAVEIATGAPMPAGADAVVMVEETERAGDEVRILTPVYPRQNVGRQGADIAVGQIVIRDGDVLNPSRIGALAALGVADVEVYARPTVAILSTGNEIIDPGPGAAAGPDLRHQQVHAEHHHPGTRRRADAVRHGARHHRGARAGASTRALACDVLVFSGGSSVGERDLILDVIGRHGEIAVSRHCGEARQADGVRHSSRASRCSACRATRPRACRTPTCCWCRRCRAIGAPAARATPHTVSLPLAQRIVSTTGRHQFYTVRIVDGQAMPAFKASGDITSMSKADGYIEIPAQTDIVEKGQVVDVKLF